MCYIKGGIVGCKGNDSYGQLDVPDGVKGGVLRFEDLELGVQLKNIFTNVENVMQLKLGWDYSCAVNTYGKCQCWGLNALGQTDIPEDMK